MRQLSEPRAGGLRYPQPRPVAGPVMFQSWCELSFLHWRFPVEVVQRRVPEPLAVESFDGSAWVGVTPFVVRGLRPPLLPALPWVSEFPETNCRTYVRAPDGSSGVWFFSLDAARAPAVAAARLGYGLPYAWSRMEVTKTGRERLYESCRVWPDTKARTSIRVIEREAAEASDREIFLTARFRLYSFIWGRLTYTDVEHARWPLASAEVVTAEQTLIEAAGLPRPADPPIAHFSPGVDVRIARPKYLG